ncbi:ribonuclease T2 [Dothidotthia symphoricarpi CBS 119687]|uniref:Ribonuclease T2-like n=1 Tax=Dothidotthia symphoricarpi CBS 119687 TaxID=1392245 RepID=A0A6A6AHM7_9PLEO|nr:ribonuclease T2 [Dothidotthia symphoricarpi CBS 119687]KAF2129931.1 ribonuclease T2 [Dothidotthia symphoricarpi CBS 119687]
MVDSWLQAVKDGVQNAVASSTSSMPETSAMPSLRTISKLALGGAQVLLGGGERAVGGYTQSCPLPQLSCHNTTVVENLCCFNAPGGQLLQTQFWDTHPVTGPEDSWTLHGLWPDRCDGSFEANCDPSRAYNNISSILTSFNATDLLTFMHTYWKDYQGDDFLFWTHEWSKHGTCISTLNPECYPDHRATEEVVDYFQRAVDLFKTLPSYDWLKAAGIEPSFDKTYTFQAIQDALAVNRPGVEVTLGCKYGRLNEIWYHFDVRGSLQTGDFVPADPDGTKSSCPKSGIKYLPKVRRTGPPGTTTTVGVPGPTHSSVPGKPFTGRGHLNVEVNGKKTGCVIGKGTWYTSGTCATFTATEVDNGFTLTSSKGKCGIVSGVLTCNNGVTYATGFTNVDGNLAVGGNAVWSADNVAKRYTQEKIYAGNGHSEKISIEWQGA